MTNEQKKTLEAALSGIEHVRCELMRTYADTSDAMSVGERDRTNDLINSLYYAGKSVTKALTGK